MTATTLERKTDTLHDATAHREWVGPMPDYVGDAEQVILAGTMVGRVLATGVAAAVTSTTGLKTIGKACETYRWSAALEARGFAKPEVEAFSGIHGWDPNGGETFTKADRSKMAYGVDNKTVSKVSTGKSAAGPIYDVQEGQVFVRSGDFVPTVATETADPVQGGEVTLVAGIATIAAGAFKLDASDQIILQRKTPGGTVGADYEITARTNGAPGTATFAVRAVDEDGALVNTDTSTLTWTIITP